MKDLLAEGIFLLGCVLTIIALVIYIRTAEEAPVEYVITAEQTPKIEQVPRPKVEPPIVEEILICYREKKVFATPSDAVKGLTLMEQDNNTYIGGFQLTAYEWSGFPCANGNYPTVGYTAACNSLPIGTRIYIDGYGEYVIEDRGGMAGNVIDIYMGDYGSCIQFGRQYGEVYIVE